MTLFSKLNAKVTGQLAALALATGCLFSPISKELSADVLSLENYAFDNAPQVEIETVCQLAPGVFAVSEMNTINMALGASGFAFVSLYLRRKKQFSD